MPDSPMEQFNDVCVKIYFLPQQCRDHVYFAEELCRFKTLHNTRQCSAKPDAHAPCKVHTTGKSRFLPREGLQHRQSLP